MQQNKTKWTRWAMRLLMLYLVLQLLWPLFFKEIIWPAWTGYLKLGSLVVLTALTAYHLTSTLLFQWKELRSRPGEKNSLLARITRTCAPRLPVDPVVLTSVLLIVPALLIAAAVAYNLPTDFLSALSTLTAMLPLLVLLFPLRTKQLGQQKRQFLAALWFISLLLFIGFGGLLVTNWLDLGLRDTAAVRWINYFDAGTVLMQKKLTAAIALLLLGLMAYWTWCLWKLALYAEQAKEKPVESPSGKRKKERASDFVIDFAALSTHLSKKPEFDDKNFHQNLTEKLQELDKNCSESLEDESNENRSDFFSGWQPTPKQWTFYQLFNTKYTESLENLCYLQHENAIKPDIFLQGPAASGITTAMVAAATHVALVRGQNVLYLVANNRTAELVEKSFHNNVVSHRLNVTVYRKTQTKALYILRLTKKTEADIQTHFTQERSLILISTLENAERSLYVKKPACVPVESLSVVMVDGFHQFSQSARDHLPFFLAKHALLLASVSLPRQIVVSSTRIQQEYAARLLGTRLFSVKHYSSDNTVMMETPKFPQKITWHQICIPHRLLGEVLHFLKNSKIYPLVTGPGFTQDDWKKLGYSSSQHGASTIFSSFDHPSTNQKFKVIVLIQSVEDEVITAVASRWAQPGTIICSVIFTDSTELATEERCGSRPFPIVVDRTAREFALRHLLTLAVRLPVRHPFPAEYLTLLGIDVTDYAKGSSSITHQEYRPILTLGYEHLDESEQTNQDPEKRIWDMCWLESNPGEVNPDPATAEVMSSNLRVFPTARKGAGDQVTNQAIAVGRLTDINMQASIIRRRALWELNDGTKAVHETDLATAEEYRLSTSGTTFVPRTIAEDMENNRIIIHAKSWIGKGEDDFLPCHHLSWRVDQLQCENLLLRGKDGYLMTSLAPVVEDNKQPNQTFLTSCHLSALMDVIGEIAKLDQDVSFQYETIPSLLLLRPRPTGKDQTWKNLLPGAIKGDWQTLNLTTIHAGMRFSPFLSYLLQIVLNNTLPGFYHFAKIAAFMVVDVNDTASPAQGLLWLHEPCSHGKSASHILREVLGDDSSRQKLWENASAILDECSENKQEQPLRRRARMAFAHDDRTAAGWTAQDEWGLVKNLLEALGNPKNAETLEIYQPPAEGDDQEDPAPEDTGKIKPNFDRRKRQWYEDVTPWSDCLDRLWSNNKAFPELATQDLSSWDKALTFLIDVVIPEGFSWEELIDFLNQSATIKASEGVSGGLVINPGISQTGNDFLAALKDLLPKLFEHSEFSEVFVLRLQLWAADRDQKKVEPSIFDPINVILNGGFHREGLWLVEKIENTPQIPNPAPEPLPIPDIEDTEATSITPEILATLTSAPLLNAKAGIEYSWEFNGKTYAITWGFDEENHKKRYLSTLDAFSSRISIEESYSFYIYNDPFLQQLETLAQELLRLYGRKQDAEFPLFLLSFIQFIPYIPDPEIKDSDWPRWPSEYFILGGGDCEDSSIAYAYLLLYFDYSANYMSMPRHIAVAVAGNYSGWYYENDGQKFYYAETATSGYSKPIGDDSELLNTQGKTPSKVSLVPIRLQEDLLTSAIAIINQSDNENTPQVTLLVRSKLPTVFYVEILVRNQNTDKSFTLVCSAKINGQDLNLGQVFQVDFSHSLIDQEPGTYHLMALVRTDKLRLAQWYPSRSYRITRI